MLTGPAELRLKKHVASTGHVGWTVRYPLFERPTAAELADIALGSAGFGAAHAGTLLYPDPFLRRVAAEREFLLRDLVIVPGGSPASLAQAKMIRGAISDRFGEELRIESAATLSGGLRADAPLLLLGGSDANPLSAALAKKYQVGAFCADHPGDGAWGITTHWELEADLRPRYLLACDEGTAAEAIRTFLDGVVSGDGDARLRWLHAISPLPATLGLSAPFEEWLRGRHGWNPVFREWFAEPTPRTSYREYFFRWFQQDLPTHLPYSGQLIDLGIDAVRFYQLTGDIDGLTVFREMLAGYGDLLAQDEPDVYVSDLDFRLGTACNLWNWVRHHPSVSAEESEAVSQVLLGLTRMVVRYFENLWKDKPSPHNHQTFKARSMIQAWRYFGPFEGVPDRDDWKTTADQVFGAISPNADKFRENATQYEAFVPEHLLVWQEVTGAGRSRDQRNSLVRGALRQWAMRDSFLQPVEYGDADPVPRSKQPLQVSAWLCGDADEEERLQALESGPGRAFPFEFPSAVQSFHALPHAAPAPEAQHQPETGWSRQPLDPTFAANHGITSDPETLFDKLVWRSAWEPGATYCAIEGIGRGNREPFVRHAHHEANSVLRLNLGGRIWLVNNGYGKQEGVRSAKDAYRTRQLGPEDHNTLVVRERGASGDHGVIEPPGHACLIKFGDTPFPGATTVLSGYGGITWKRHTLIPHPHCVIFIDEVIPESGDTPSFELQWNVLGERLDGGDGPTRFAQNGVTLVFDHFGTGHATWGESTIQAWKHLIRSGQYPHTSSPPNHGRVTRVDTESAAAPVPFTFVSGLWLDGVVTRRSWDANAQRLELDLTPEMRVSWGVRG